MMKKQWCMLGAAMMLAVFRKASSEPVAIEKLPKVTKKTTTRKPVRTSYIVELDDEPILSFEGTRPFANQKLDPNNPLVQEYSAFLETKHEEAAAAIGVQKIWSYKYALNGFLVKLSDEEAKTLSRQRNVLNVRKDEMRQVQTIDSAAFLGLSGPGQPWSFGYTGEDVVIGVIDTGVNPEHPSFADIATPFNGNTGPNTPYKPPPHGWTGSACEFGNQDFNLDDLPANCNNKILTAKCFATFFSDVVDPSLPCGGDGTFLNPDDFLSARDAIDHGSHVAATAAGNYGVEAIIDNETVAGLITGMAPRAKLAIYKACWGTFGECGTSDVLAALDQAIVDGVNVLNLSFGSVGTGLIDGPEIKALLRVSNAGIYIATAVGNDGPLPGTLSDESSLPWVTAVGASTDDSVTGFGLHVSSPLDVAGTYVGILANSTVTLEDIGGMFEGEIVPAEPADACSEIQNDLTGKIALVMRGTCVFSDKFNNVSAAGAKVIVVYNDGENEERMSPFPMSAQGTSVPGIMISYENGILLNATAYDRETIIGAVQNVTLENRIAEFSSRGPNFVSSDVIKPDIVAPGVDILSAGTPFDAGGPDDGQIFENLKGTSMAAPHVAGVFALLKQAHPEWSPAMAKSALMTTAQPILTTMFGSGSRPFDRGSGNIVTGQAFDPGLAYDARTVDYEAFSCGLNAGIVSQDRCDELAALGISFDASSLNYPSIGIGELAGIQTIVRTVTNVAMTEGRKTFVVSVDAPPGVAVTVNPSSISLARGENATYEVTFTTTDAAILDEWAFGSLTWSNRGGGLRKHPSYSVRSPIAVKPVLFDAPFSVSYNGLNGSKTFDVNFGYVGSYAAGIHGLSKAFTEQGTVAQSLSEEYFFDMEVGIKRFRFEFPPDTLFARFATFDEYVEASDEHDLDLYVWECFRAFNIGGTESCTILDFSAGASSREQVDVPFPLPYDVTNRTFYIVDVHGFFINGSEANFTLFEWDFGFDDDRQNMVVDAPEAATLDETSITVTWPGENELEEGSKYLGAITHTGPPGLIGATLIEIET